MKPFVEHLSLTVFNTLAKVPFATFEIEAVICSSVFRSDFLQNDCSPMTVIIAISHISTIVMRVTVFERCESRCNLRISQSHYSTRAMDRSAKFVLIMLDAFRPGSRPGTHRMVSFTEKLEEGFLRM